MAHTSETHPCSWCANVPKRVFRRSLGHLRVRSLRQPEEDISYQSLASGANRARSAGSIGPRLSGGMRDT